MASSLADEVARSAFLAALEHRLREQGSAGLSWERKIVSPFGISGLIFTADGVPGEARVVPVSLVRPNLKSFEPFPGNGVPLYQFTIVDTSDARDAPAWVTNVAAYDLENAVQTLLAWRTSYDPVEDVLAPPLRIDDLAPLRAIVDVLHAAASPAIASRESLGPRESAIPGLSPGFDPDNPPGGLIDDAREEMRDDLRHLDAERLLTNIPRDAKGRMELDQEILLASYASSTTQSRGRQMWLVARTPKRRKDEPAITLDIDSLIGENHPHRWDGARWLWDGRAADATEEERWGVANLPVARLGAEERAANLNHMLKACSVPDASHACRVALCILLQDEGRIADAYDVAGVEMAPEVRKLLHGHPISLKELPLLARWTTALQRELRAAAPWRFAAALVGSEPSGKRKERRLRLFALPNQVHQSKASLMLAEGDNAPRLEIEYTASNARLPFPLWRRPLELDLLRFGLQNSANGR